MAVTFRAAREYHRRMGHASWISDPAPLLVVGPGFSLAEVDTSSTPGISGDKKDGQAILEENRAELNDLQERLWAESLFDGPRSVLLVLQAMDTAGKGGIVQHVIGGINPQGVQDYGFKKPTTEELAHDFLWRVRKRLPVPGVIGVFDRSHYEDVLIARVHNLAEPAIITQRYGQIRDFEEEIAASGTTIVKVMLHISLHEQKQRLLQRLERDDKNWKFNPGDVDERELWPQYQEAYQLALEKTSTAKAPWYVVPADHKWYARIAVQRLLLDALRALRPQWPLADYDVDAEKARLAAS
jgi:PPK2 family polyphosphate:nucleotide phosphotransferase